MKSEKGEQEIIEATEQVEVETKVDEGDSAQVDSKENQDTEAEVSEAKSETKDQEKNREDVDNKAKDEGKPEIIMEAKVVNPQDDKKDRATAHAPKAPTAATEVNNNHSGKGTAALVMSALALVAGCGGLALGWLGYERSQAPVTYLSSGVDGNSANFVEGSIADIVEKVSKSVVSIVTSTKTTNYFGQSSSSSAAGTGIIVTADGYIVTNKHVVNGASKVTVVLDDGTTYENVKVVVTDPLNDIAFLKIDGVTDLSPATLGDSKTVSVGQQVIAIGNALGEYQNTVTSGIISGTGRSVTASDGSGTMTETLTDMIQIDAAINTGNSGGPLLNAAGEVIGINTATSTSAENMGFAIPICSIKGMLEQLKETGTAERAYLGVYNVEITPDVAKSFELPVTKGAYVYSSSNYTAVAQNSPAAKAGLKDKDVITKVNGIEVGVVGSLSNLISEYKPGDVIDLTIIREGKEMSVKVTLEGYNE